MLRVGTTLVLLLCVAQLGRAQAPRIYAQDQKFGCGRITTIEKLTPMNKPAAPKEGDAADGRPTDTLRPTNWTCGRCFTDELARRWCLVQGCPPADKPALLKGWIMQGDLGNLFFLDEGGNLYRRGGERHVPNARE